jgi:hypothetical protein
MTRSRLLPALALLALLAVLTPFAWAAPSPPLVAVNRSTGQCTLLFSGDECTSCAVPADWEVLGTAGEVECPAGSAVIGPGLTCFGIHLALPVGMAAWWLGRRGSRP